MSEKIRMGIIACGPRARQMARIVRLLPQFQMKAMSDPDHKNLQAAQEQFPELTYYSSSEEMLDKGGLDAVIIETPPALHNKYALMAFERGLHVMGEIPAVETYDEAVELWKTAKSHKELVYMCGATANYRQKTRMLNYLKQHNLVGKMVYAEAEYVHGMVRTFNQSKYSPDAWRANYAACKYCTHSLGPLLDFLEEGDLYDSVACMGTGRHFPCNWRDHAMVSILNTRNNVVTRFLASFALYGTGPYHTTRIYTDDGMFELYNEKIRIFKPEFTEYAETPSCMELPFGRFPKRFVDDFPIDEVLAAGGGGHGGADFIMLEDFADAIINNKPSPVSVEKGLAMTLPGIFAAESASEGGVLKKIRYPWEEEKI